MSALAYDLSTVRVLWQRDIMRFLRQPTRIVGALGQPIIFWWIIGAGLSATFVVPGLHINYLEYFFPGVVVMVLLFASIFASVSVIDDRHQGFLQAVLAGPGSRSSLVAGKCLGSATLAGLQAGVFLLLAPLAGFSLGNVHWPMLLCAMLATSLGLTALGFAVAWWLDNLQAYHAVQMTLLVPLWVVSGAMFPTTGLHAGWALALQLNPVSYAVSVVRHALYGGAAPASVALTSSPWMEVGVLGAMALCAWLLAVTLTERRR